MPKKNNNNGSPIFDLKNMEQAQKLIDKIYYTAREITANYNNTRNLDNYIDKMEDLRKLYEQLQKYYTGNAKLTKYDNSEAYQREMIYLEKILNAQKESIEYEAKRQLAIEETKKAMTAQKEEQQKMNDEIKKTTDNLRNFGSSWRPKNESISLNSLGSSLLSNKLMAAQEKDAEQINNITDRVISAHLKNGTLTPDNEKNIQKEITQTLNREFKSSATKLNLAAEGLDAAGKILNQAASTWLSVAKVGKNNQTNAFQNTFEGISVRTGLTRGEYYGMQSNTNNILGELGLRNNIRTSDVQEMWSTLTKQGINIDTNREQYIANAIDTVLTNKIVPYLDTSDAYYQQLMTNEPSFNKQIRGINLAANELLGSSVVITDHLQDLVTNISPMATLAEQELGVQYAKSLGTYEAMRQSGYSDYEIGQYMSTAESVYRDPYAALNSDKLDKNLAAVYALSGGGDMRNYAYMTENTLKGIGTATSLIPGGNWTPLFAGAMGVTSLDAIAATGAVDRNFNGNLSNYRSMGDILASNLNKYSNIATNNYRNDVNQTNRTLQDITVENFMNELSVVNEWMGHWTDVAVTALNGIKALLITWLGSKLFGNIGSNLSGIGSARKTRINWYRSRFS